MWVPLAMFAAVASLVWVAVWIGNTQFAHDGPYGKGPPPKVPRKIGRRSQGP